MQDCVVVIVLVNNRASHGCHGVCSSICVMQCNYLCLTLQRCHCRAMHVSALTTSSTHVWHSCSCQWLADGVIVNSSTSWHKHVPSAHPASRSRQRIVSLHVMPCTALMTHLQAASCLSSEDQATRLALHMHLNSTVVAANCCPLKILNRLLQQRPYSTRMYYK